MSINASRPPTEVPAIFELHNHQLRAIIDRENKPLFVAKDACDYLDLGNVTNALAKVPKHHLTLIRLRSGGQIREMNAVDEPGLYWLISRSDKPKAIEFMDWIFSEVLPAIRKQGYYAVMPPTEIPQDHDLACSAFAFGMKIIEELSIPLKAWKKHLKDYARVIAATSKPYKVPASPRGTLPCGNGGEA